MELRTLGKTKLLVSPLCLGTMTFGAQTDEATSRSMLDFSLERGINFVDTANVYNAGLTEEILGRALAGRRDRVILASKVGIKNDQLPGEGGLSKAAIVKAIENTLRRLKTDYVDLYYLHQPDYAVLLEESLAAMDQLVRSGKVRFIGASNYASWQVCRMLWLAETSGWQPVTVVQPMYNLLARGIEQELLPMCQSFGLPVVPYNPLAGGLLTGKHTSAAPLPGSRFERMPFYRDRYWHASNFEAVSELAKIAAAAGRTLTQFALGWLLQNPAVTSVIVGASSLRHLEENLAVLNAPPLPPESLAACDDVGRKLRGITPQYNR
jgi:aryl-alcohol dehydrogenase (NADP+)